MTCRQAHSTCSNRLDEVGGTDFRAFLLLGEHLEAGRLHRCTWLLTVQSNEEGIHCKICPHGTYLTQQVSQTGEVPSKQGDECADFTLDIMLLAKHYLVKVLKLGTSLSSSFSLCQGRGAARNFFTASSDRLFHLPLSLVFFFQSSSSHLVYKYGWPSLLAVPP